MALDVKVKIQLSKPIGSAGFGYPLILESQKGNAEATAVEYTECYSLDDVTTAGYETDSAVYKAAALIFMQNNAPEKIAVMSTADSIVDTLPKIVNKDWRQLIVTAFSSEAGDSTKDTIEKVAEYIETTHKMYFTSFSEKSKLTTAYNTIKSYDRTFVVYHTSTDIANPEAAIVGATAGLKVGSFTYKNIIIKGVPALEISESEITAIHAIGGNTILEKAGDIVTSEGKVASGEYADIDSEDYIIQNIEYKVQKVFNVNAKVPYTDNGIGMLETTTLGVLVDAYNNGMIAQGEDGKPIYNVSFALRSQTTEADRAARKYPYGKFSFALSGAIHNAEITGEITV